MPVHPRSIPIRAPANTGDLPETNLRLSYSHAHESDLMALLGHCGCIVPVPISVRRGTGCFVVPPPASAHHVCISVSCRRKEMIACRIMPKYPVLPPRRRSAARRRSPLDTSASSAFLSIWAPAAAAWTWGPRPCAWPGWRRGWKRLAIRLPTGATFASRSPRRRPRAARMRATSSRSPRPARAPPRPWSKLWKTG